ncbi:MAG: DUF1648 domain-containing protein [Hungatella sp.]|nr:DUF1648 domain-containing protein [Hungatella sp.]
MKRRTIIGTVICILTMVIFLIFYNKLPDQVPIHFDSKGNVNSYWPKRAVVFGLPVIFELLNIIASYSLRIKGENRECMYYIVPAISIVTTVVILILGLR